MGVSGLNYSVGFLRYSKASSGGGNNDLLIIIIPAMMGVIVLMLTALAVLCCIVGVMIRRKRAYKAKRRLKPLINLNNSQKCLRETKYVLMLRLLGKQEC